MRRRFNITGSCNPQRHYMVKLDDRLKRIQESYIDDGSYFVINRGRQYGKTTTLRALEEYLKDDYVVLLLDFQQIGTEEFADAQRFVCAFTEVLIETLEMNELSDREELLKPLRALMDKNSKSLKNLFVSLNSMCKNSTKPVVLMIDEVDSASNNQVFIDFLALLRSYYLNRDRTTIFHSVILAGVYSVKNLKLYSLPMKSAVSIAPAACCKAANFHMRPCASFYTERSVFSTASIKLRPESGRQYNSPWNIAADFDIVMSFSADQIAGMLEEYEADYHMGMDIQAVSKEIYDYISGYPVLVSSICKRIDEKIIGEGGSWSHEGIERAVKAILVDSAPLFESMIRHLNEYTDMKKMFQAILFQGSEFSYSPDTKEISLACMFGYAVNGEGKVQIANRIFETRLYNYFLSEEELSSTISKMARRDKSYFIQDGHLDMDMTLKKFVEYFTDIYGDNDDVFIEDYGRKFFLLFLKPIINGVGNYYIEAQTRDARRTDVIVDYLGEQFIVELKIWHGSEYNERGEKQLLDYLAYYHKDKGYMLSFNFNKNKRIGVNEIKIDNKTIVEAVV